MKCGEDMVEEIFYARADTVEIALRGMGQIGAALYFFPADSESPVAEIGWEPVVSRCCRGKIS